MASAILEQRGVAQWGQIACVQSAIIFDLGARDTLEYPTRPRCGRLACGQCRRLLGWTGRRREAGDRRQTLRAPRYRPELGGQGAAFREVSGVKILVITVVNALGVVVDRSGNVVRGLVDVETGRRAHPRDVLDPGRNPAYTSEAAADGNTTVTAVVINRKIERAVLVQLARQVHASMARAIQPFHTIRDGDVLFALSTEEVASDSLEDCPRRNCLTSPGMPCSAPLEQRVDRQSRMNRQDPGKRDVACRARRNPRSQRAGAGTGDGGEGQLSHEVLGRSPGGSRRRVRGAPPRTLPTARKASTCPIWFDAGR